MTDTTEAPLSRTPARFFFENGYFAAYAEASIRAGNRAPFELTDAIVDRAWDIAPNAHPDHNEFDRYLSAADSADAGLAEAEANYRAYWTADRESTGTREEMATCAQNLRVFGAELFPANRNGQGHFARIIMDTVANSIDAYLERKAASALFIVWSPDGGPSPTVEHKAHAGAHRAAQLLAKQHPGKTFIVMAKSGRRIRAEASA